MPDLHFATHSGELGGYLAQPIGEGPYPGVIVIQDVLGLSDDMREQADRLAAAGYLAFAPDLYSGRGIRCVVATMRASRSGSGPAYEDIEAARAYLIAARTAPGEPGSSAFAWVAASRSCAPRAAATRLRQLTTARSPRTQQSGSKARVRSSPATAPATAAFLAAPSVSSRR